MKLLLDENISDRLLRRFDGLYPGSEHVCSLGFGGGEDAAIWEYAKQHGFYIVTQDADFVERIELYGAPPKVIWLRCGNAPTREVERILRANAKALAELETNPDLHIIELSF